MLAAAILAVVVATACHRRVSLVKETVVVHTKDGKTIKGVLEARRSDEWIVREAEIVTPSGTTTLGGFQHVPVANISFAQHLPPRDPTGGQ